MTRLIALVNNEKGVALVIALIMLLVLTFVGLSAITMMSYETNIAGNERLYNIAFYTSDGGLENFRGRVSAGEFVYTVVSTGSYQVAIGGNQCNISYDRWKKTEMGTDYAVFKVLSEGRAPFPARGRVAIESIIEVMMNLPEGYN